jgi:Fe-Mn family superoxide dismutase
MKDSVTPAELDELLKRKTGIKVLDVRRRDDRVDVEHPIPDAEWRDPERIAEWSKEVGGDAEVVVFCVKGHSVCQDARDFLRKQGIRAKSLDGGIEAWQAFSKRS